MSKIEIEFDDLNFHQNIGFPNNHEFSLAYMSESGALLASQVFSESLDDFVADIKGSCLLFRSFGVESAWQCYLPSSEYPEALCVSTCCVVYTSLNNLRIFTLGGIQTIIISMPGPVVTMASYQSNLAIIYHNAAPVYGCQSLTGEIWFTNELGVESKAEYFKEEFKVAITPKEKVVWMGYSDTGVLYTVDSAKILRGLWKRAMNWVPLCNIQEYYRIVGVTDSQIMLNLGENYKRIELQDFDLPLCKGKSLDYEKEMVKKHFFLENQSEIIDKSKQFVELDKFTLGYYTKAVDEGDIDKAFAYGMEAKLPKTRLLFIKYAQELKVYTLADRLAKSFNIILPSRFIRPERVIEEQPANANENKIKSSKIEVKSNIKEITKENPKESPKENKEKYEPSQNPFSKNNNKSKDIFEELSSGLKRKPENSATSLKKIKK